MKVANKYSDYRLKIYADQYKLKLKPNSPFIETERQGTVCFTYIGDQSKDHIMTLSKIDRMTSSFQNEEELLDHFFYRRLDRYRPTVKIYKKRKDYRKDDWKDITLEPFYACEEVSLLLDSVKEDGVLLNTRKKSYRKLKELYTLLFQPLTSQSFSSYLLKHSETVPTKFLKLYDSYWRESKSSTIQKELADYEKNQLNHYSKFRGILLTYRQYQNWLKMKNQNQKKGMERLSEPSFEESLLKGEVYLSGVPKQIRFDFENACHDLRMLREKIDSWKKKKASVSVMAEIEQLEALYQEKFLSIQSQYDQILDESQIVDDEIVGFKEEMEEGSIYYGGSHK